jgi:hypothetical protein
MWRNKPPFVKILVVKQLVPLVYKCKSKAIHGIAALGFKLRTISLSLKLHKCGKASK